MSERRLELASAKGLALRRAVAFHYGPRALLPNRARTRSPLWTYCIDDDWSFFFWQTECVAVKLGVGKVQQVHVHVCAQSNSKHRCHTPSNDQQHHQYQAS